MKKYIKPKIATAVINTTALLTGSFSEDTNNAEKLDNGSLGSKSIFEYGFDSEDNDNL